MNAPSSRWLARRAGACWGSVLWLASACGPATPARDAQNVTELPPSSEATSEAASEPAPISASAPEVPSAAEPSAATSGAAVDLDGGDDLDADIAALSKATKGPEAKTEGLSGRDVVYRVTPQGLVIELSGIHLRPVAKAFRDPKGAYGVELLLTAESFDDRQYWLSKPAQGPLSIAGRIEAASGKRVRFGDERRGDGEEVVRAGEPRQFKQRWPGKGQPKLRAGETLTLEVGLWGVHVESERERPVKRLFEVKLVGAQPPQAVISPPTLDWGS